MTPVRAAAVAGVLYVALDIVVGASAGAPPSPAAGEAEILDYVAGHGTGLAAGLWLFGLAAIFLLWWFGSLWVRMTRAEEGTPRLAVVSLAGLLLGGTMAFASAAVLAALAFSVGSEAVVTNYTLAAVLLSAAGFGLAAHLISANTVAAGSGMLPRWLVVVGMVAATAFLVSAVLGALSNDATSNSVSLVGFALWLVWILGVSHRMWTDPTWSNEAPGPVQDRAELTRSPG